MKKHFKYLAAAGLIAALFLSAGCGDDAKDKKPAPEPEKKVENVVVKPQDGKYYRYPDYINDVTKTPKMTPEIVKYIDDFASTLKFHPDSKGKFTNNSLIKSPEEKFTISICLLLVQIITIRSSLKIPKVMKFISRRFTASI